MAWSDEHAKGYREAGTFLESVTPTMAEAQGRDAALNGLGGPGTAEQLRARMAVLSWVISGIIAFFVALLAILGTPVLALGAALSRPRPQVSSAKPPSAAYAAVHLFRAYMAMFLVLLAHIGLAWLWYILVLHSPDLTPLLAHGDTTGWGRLLAEPSVLVGTAGAEILAILVGSIIVQCTLKDAFPGVLGLLKALVATIFAVAASLGSFVYFIATREGAYQIEETGTSLLVRGLLIGAYALLGAPVGALAIGLVYVTAPRRDRPSFWRALYAAFLGLAAYAFVVSVWDTVSPAFVPLASSLADAYKAAHGVTTSVHSPPVAPSVGAFLADQAVAFAAFVLVVSAGLGGENPGVARWVRSAVSAGLTWSGAAALVFALWVASPGSRSHSSYPSATRPLVVSEAVARERPAPAAAHAPHHDP